MSKWTEQFHSRKKLGTEEYNEGHTDEEGMVVLCVAGMCVAIPCAEDRKGPNQDRNSVQTVLM